jgi:hypothetical protein
MDAAFFLCLFIKSNCRLRALSLHLVLAEPGSERHLDEKRQIGDHRAKPLLPFAQWSRSTKPYHTIACACALPLCKAGGVTPVRDYRRKSLRCWNMHQNVAISIAPADLADHPAAVGLRAQPR